MDAGAKRSGRAGADLRVQGEIEQMSTVTLRGLAKSFGSVRVITGADLQVESGEFVVLVGPSGCGKSTLLRMIAGLETVSDGQILIDGDDVTEVDPADRGVAMVFQSYALYPHMTVGQNIGFGLRMSGMPKPEVAEKVAKAAETLELTPLLDRKPKALSGGQRQRVAIGRAIVRDPKVFLFDEPLSNLDAELRVQMRVEIARMHQRMSATMIYVTHDQTEAMTLADRIVVLRAGHIEQIGKPVDLYNNPDNRFVAGFVGSPAMNFVPVVAVGPRELSLTDLPNQRVTLPITSELTVGTQYELGIRPEHLHPGHTGALPMTLDCEVIENLGSVSFAHLRLGSVPVVAAVDNKTAYTHPKTLDVSVDPETLFLFDTEGHRVR
jgi:lactose/L-arabinose transport system ATP-binding protein